MIRFFLFIVFFSSCTFIENPTIPRFTDVPQPGSEDARIKAEDCLVFHKKTSHLFDNLRVYSSLKSVSQNTCEFMSIIPVGKEKPYKTNLNLSNFTQNSKVIWEGKEYGHTDEIVIPKDTTSIAFEIIDPSSQRNFRTNLYLSQLPVLRIHDDEPDVPIADKKESLFELDTYDEIIPFSAFSNTRGYGGYPIKQLAVYPSAPVSPPLMSFLKSSSFETFDEFMLSPEHTDRSLLRNLVNHSIYNMFSQKHGQDSVINGFHLDVFYNNTYKGVFFFSNTIHSKYENKNIKSPNDVLQLLNLKAGVTRYNQDGFKNLYGTDIPPDITHLINSSETYAQDNLDAISAANYISTIYASNAGDNIENNIFFITSQSKIYTLPWDFEWSFGNFPITRATVRFDINLATQKLIQNTTIFSITKNPIYCQKVNHIIKDNLNYLRESDFINTEFLKHYDYLSQSGAYERSHESLPRGYARPFGEDDLNDITDWVKRRMDFLSSIEFTDCKPI